MDHQNVAFGGTAQFGITHTTTLTLADIDVAVYVDESTVEDQALTTAAQGALRIDTVNDQVAFGAFSVAGQAAGKRLRIVVSSNGSNFQAQQSFVTVGPELRDVVLVRDANGAACATATTAVVVNGN